MIEISLCTCRMAKFQELDHPLSQEKRLLVTWLSPTTPILCGTHFLCPRRDAPVHQSPGSLTSTLLAASC